MSGGSVNKVSLWTYISSSMWHNMIDNWLHSLYEKWGTIWLHVETLLGSRNEAPPHWSALENCCRINPSPCLHGISTETGFLSRLTLPLDPTMWQRDQQLIIFFIWKVGYNVQSYIQLYYWPNVSTVCLSGLIGKNREHGDQLLYFTICLVWIYHSVR